MKTSQRNISKFYLSRQVRVFSHFYQRYFHTSSQWGTLSQNFFFWTVPQLGVITCFRTYLCWTVWLLLTQRGKLQKIFRVASSPRAWNHIDKLCSPQKGC
uniref:Uncharacterized protein n=1 Tax=Trypanosoma congolense (strain IL3000) TaxID=1068625 RepID=G0URK5_TRYCI|nr:hypothetical protein, unlikely [Trypanosoma congolense IL3000]